MSETKANETKVIVETDENEKDVVEVVERPGNYTHHFSEEQTFGDKKYKTLTFYFNNLTGSDIEAIEEELTAQSKYIISPEVSSLFQGMLAARAANVSHYDIRNLPVRDYMKIKNKARDFLVNAGY